MPAAKLTAAEAARLVVVPNWLPPTYNQLHASSHWAKRARLKKEAAEIVSAYAHMQNVPKATGKRRVSLVLTLTKGRRRPDGDAWWKSVADALVTCGLLKDDGPKWCEFGTVEYRRGADRTTEIWLEDLP